MKNMSEWRSLLRATRDHGAYCIFRSMLCFALLGASTSVVAQQDIVERCVSGGGVTTEQCNCTDQFGRAATRQCRQLVSDQTGSPTGRNGVCGLVCDQCQCASSSPPVNWPQVQGRQSNANEIKICVTEFEGDCPPGTTWRPCEQDSHEGAPAVGDRLCRARGMAGASTFEDSKQNLHKCGLTVYRAVCR